MNLTILRLSLIKHEGVRLTPYTDTTGNLTVGVGRNLSKPLSKQVWGMMLTEDIDEAVENTKDLPWFLPLNDTRQRVIVEMVFNMGLQRFLTFHNFISAVKTGNFELASFEMLNSIWASQVGQKPGQRAHTLSIMMFTGQEI